MYILVPEIFINIEYILLVNYLFCRNEDASGGIWDRLYFQLAEHPKKLYLLTEYIEMLPDDIRGKAQEQLCRSLAEAHIIRTGSFDMDTFYDKFKEMMIGGSWVYSQYIIDIDACPKKRCEICNSFGKSFFENISI
mgnify:CR=1 FL=1